MLHRSAATEENGEDISDNAQKSEAAQGATLQVNLAESIGATNRKEDGNMFYEELNNEEDKDGEEEDNQENEPDDDPMEDREENSKDEDRKGGNEEDNDPDDEPEDDHIEPPDAVLPDLVVNVGDMSATCRPTPDIVADFRKTRQNQRHEC